MKACVCIGRNTKYNQDFNNTVVDLYHNGQPVKVLSSEYGVSEVTIYKWINKYTPMTLQQQLLTENR